MLQFNEYFFPFVHRQPSISFYEPNTVMTHAQIERKTTDSVSNGSLLILVRLGPSVGYLISINYRVDVLEFVWCYMVSYEFLLNGAMNFSDSQRKSRLVDVQPKCIWSEKSNSFAYSKLLPIRKLGCDWPMCVNVFSALQCFQDAQRTRTSKCE